MSTSSTLTPAAAKPKPIELLKTTLSIPSVQEQFRNALAENAPLFIASLIDIYGNDTYLQKCNPNAVIIEALKAATLKLPINKNLGFAWIVPYGDKPQFQVGWKGYIQLAIRTGQYKKINAGIIYEGQKVHIDFLTGDVTISGEPKTETAIGYFAYIELVNGFSKAVFWTKEKVHAHARKYSKSYNTKGSAWQIEPDAMCIKTVLSALIRKYGIMSIEMGNAFSSDQDERTPEARIENEIKENANAKVIDIETGEIISEPPDQERKQEPSQGQPSQDPFSGNPDF